MAATSTPPTSGPSSEPMFRPTDTVELAHSSRSLGTRLGTLAVEAGMNGAWARLASADSVTSSSGAWVNTMPMANTAVTSSEETITSRRS